MKSYLYITREPKGTEIVCIMNSPCTYLCTLEFTHCVCILNQIKEKIITTVFRVISLKGFVI